MLPSAGHYQVDCPQAVDEPMGVVHRDASNEDTPMEVLPSQPDQGRLVEEMASSSLETSSRPVQQVQCRNSLGGLGSIGGLCVYSTAF